MLHCFLSTISDIYAKIDNQDSADLQQIYTQILRHEKLCSLKKVAVIFISSEATLYLLMSVCQLRLGGNAIFTAPNLR